jgi:hypothetical protein
MPEEKGGGPAVVDDGSGCGGGGGGARAGVKNDLEEAGLLAIFQFGVSFRSTVLKVEGDVLPGFGVQRGEANFRES